MRRVRIFWYIIGLVLVGIIVPVGADRVLQEIGSEYKLTVTLLMLVLEAGIVIFLHHILGKSLEIAQSRSNISLISSLRKCWREGIRLRHIPK